MLIAQFDDFSLRETFQSPLCTQFRNHRLRNCGVTSISGDRSVQTVPTSVLTAIRDDDDDGTDDTHEAESNRYSMSLKESRSGVGRVDIGGDETCRVAGREEQTHCRCTRVYGADTRLDTKSAFSVLFSANLDPEKYKDLLVTDPSNASGDARTDTTDAKEDSKVLDTRSNVAQLDGVPYKRNEHAANNEHSALEGSV